jgi:hypothetical protein
VPTEAEAFRDQARDDIVMFLRLWRRAGGRLTGRSQAWEPHLLHYLQMASEKAAKAVLLRFGVVVSAKTLGHQSVSRLLGGAFAPQWQPHLGNAPPTPAMARTLLQVEALCPQVARHGPNVEYPWEDPLGSENWMAPCAWSFGFASRGRQLVEAAHFLRALLRRL